MTHLDPRDRDPLAPLTIEELQQRLEASAMVPGDIFGQDLDNCCSCKIPSPYDPQDET
jgi:hypothetical protein